MQFDLVVVGAGHAGCEAAAVAARLGRRVACVTFSRQHIGRLSCNPAVGGQAKGHLVREIDALGGWMGRCADATCLQFRTLNTRKGLAVQASRAQVDVDLYPRWMRRRLEALPGLELIEGEVTDLSLSGGRVVGVRLADGTALTCGAVLLTTGTFLAGVMHRGPVQTVGGRVGDGAAHALSRSLTDAGLVLGRLKTGTVPRLDGRTVRWDQLEPQTDVDPEGRFSYGPPVERAGAITCYQVHTNEAVHDVIRANLHASPMFTGAIVGRGPRYCPSIEDKVTRFADRSRHLLFLEPEGLSTDRVYVAGFSTSLPTEAQDQAIRALPGCADARIVQYGYAVEYDFADPTQLGPDLQHREVRGLYLAGQVNGTSGYEEAAAQGLVAGLSAALGEPFVVQRSEGYLGVLVDDLITRGVGGEPYRMFTSRAEHRLLLREDNADVRLMARGRALGLIDDPTWARYSIRAEQRELAGVALKQTVRPTSEVLEWLASKKLGGLGSPTTAGALLGRPGISWSSLGELVELPPIGSEVAEAVECDHKYRGYIDSAERRAADLNRLDALPLAAEMDWEGLTALSREVRDRLARIRPRTVGQASRVPGVTAAAVSYLVGWVGRQPD